MCRKENYYFYNFTKTLNIDTISVYQRNLREIVFLDFPVGI